MAPSPVEFEIDVEYQGGIEHHAVDALSYMATDGSDMTPIEDVIPVAVIDTTSNLSNKISFQPGRHRTTAYFVEDDDNIQRVQQMHLPSSNVFKNMQQTLVVNWLSTRLGWRKQNALSKKWTCFQEHSH